MIKDIIIALRKNANLTKRDVANKIGVAYQTYVNYENGKTNPDAVAIINLANIYDVSADFILGRDIYRDNIYLKSLEKSVLQNAKELFSPTDHKVRNAFEKYYYNKDKEQLTVVDYEVIDYNWFTRGQEYIVIKQNNNDMLPEISKGDNVIVKLQDKFLSNDFVLVQIEDEPAIIRKIIQKDESILMYALNSTTRENQFIFLDISINYKIIGVVVEIRKRISRI